MSLRAYRFGLLLPAVFIACDDTIFPPADGGRVIGDDFCAVKEIFGQSCVGCHQGASPAGGLDLLTDPHQALVDQASDQYLEAVLVVPRDPEGSLLYRKMSGVQGVSEGGDMPTQGPLDAATVEIVRVWIADGASADCDDTGVPTGYHPEGWQAPEEHGLGAKLQEGACTTCHGTDLSGGSVGISCDGCHAEGWRTDCLFCHGGTDNQTGAPPLGIDGTAEVSGLSFRAHTAHVEDTSLHAAFDCVQCHEKPVDVLSIGHLFVDDDTSGAAEIDMTSGLSAVGRWSPSGSCSNLYCHGHSQADNGAIEHTRTDLSCSSCHPDRSSGKDAWESRMSGEHAEHINEGISCGSCHATTVSGWSTLIEFSLHVNGTPDMSLPSGMSLEGERCTGTCHDSEGEAEVHSSRSWD